MDGKDLYNILKLRFAIKPNWTTIGSEYVIKLLNQVEAIFESL